MADTAWKRLERVAARFFGAERNPGSGCDYHLRTSRSDSTHADLYIEAKRAKRMAVATLWRDTREKAKAEGKTPMLVLREHRMPGFLIVVHCDDLDELCRQRRRALRGDSGARK